MTNQTKFMWLVATVAVMGCDHDEPLADGGRDSGTTVRDSGTDAGEVIAGVCEEDDGQCIFRHETFGDEALWTDVLRLNEVVQNMTPTAALGLGLKVDSDAVPAEVLASADLTAPATTRALLSLNAIVGIRAVVEDDTVTHIGITCALCHSTVDNSVMTGIGRRLDGWPNRDLNPGAIIAATPGLPVLAASLGVPEATARAALESWGPGRYDARFNQDTMSNPVLIPPAYGLATVALETYTGEGPISYWNAYVAVTQMGARGNFVDERVGLNITNTPDLVTPRLPALREYQFSIPAPEPDRSGLAVDAIARGQTVFQRDCASCHSGDDFTDAPTLHAAAETGMEPIEAQRSATGMYRTTPLRAVSLHPPYFHDGSAATLAAVIDHYDTELALGLTGPEQADLEVYLRSL